jgi:hypothetical protein
MWMLTTEDTQAPFPRVHQNMAQQELDLPQLTPSRAASLWPILGVGPTQFGKARDAEAALYRRRFDIIWSMPALGSTVEVDRYKPLSRFEKYLGLADALVCRQDESGHLRELADSFSHDILNLATLAGRLLWLEGVTPDQWRSHDLVAVAVDSEAYFVMMQAACDTMADVIATLGAKKNQAPAEGFHHLNQWALRSPDRLAPKFRFVAVPLPWFDEINGIRTKLVHRGADAWVYTERVTFEWDVRLPGNKVRRGNYLLAMLQRLTRSMLAFSETLGSVVMPMEQLERAPKMTAISGVYVPALTHLLDNYETPTRPQAWNAGCLLACGGYVEAAYLEYFEGFWWQFLLGLSERFGRGPALVRVPVSPSGLVDNCNVVFASEIGSYGMVAWDEVQTNQKWLDGATESIEKLSAAHNLSGALLIGRRADGDPPKLLPDGRTPIVVSGDSRRACEEAFARLARQGR